MASDPHYSIDVPRPPELPAPREGSATPRIEVVTGPERERASPPPRSTLSLLIWFLAVFSAVMIPATLWNYTRPPVYRAAATVLTTVPASRSGVGSGEADLQHVAIQRRLLLGRQLLTDTLAQVEAMGGSPPATPDDLRPMLAVDAVTGTNLVELSAEGGQPLLLAELVNGWLDAYETLRQQEIEARVGTQLVKLAEEGDSLEAKIAARRAALTRFREQHDIVTLERDSNRALNRLNTLQASLADAEDARIKAKAELAAIQAALASGQPVLAEEQASALARLEEQEAELVVRVQQLRKRYTEMFIQNDPDKRTLLEQLELLRGRIDAVRREGAQVALSEARRDVETATDRQFRLQRELAEQKVIASRFSADFEAYQDLQSDLAALDEMQRRTQSERVAVETKAIDDYPQIEVIEPAHAPRDPVRPDYLRDLGLSAIGAGGAGLLTVLGLMLFDAARAARRPAPLTGVRIWEDAAPSRSVQLAGTDAAAALGYQAGAASALPGAAPRVLMGGEVEALWELADDAERQLIGLLMCGLDVAEVAALTPAALDLEAGVVTVPTDGRGIELPPALLSLFAHAPPLLAWRNEGEVQELAGRIPLLALDAGIAHAAEVTAEVLRHTYLAYLVRQGARLTELHHVAGRMDAATVQRYAPLSPAGVSRPLAQLDLIYPVLG